MVTEPEKLAAAEEALKAMNVTDPDEARRAVAAFWSQVPALRDELGAGAVGDEVVARIDATLAAIDARLVTLEQAYVFSFAMRVPAPEGETAADVAAALRATADELAPQRP